MFSHVFSKENNRVPQQILCLKAETKHKQSQVALKSLIFLTFLEEKIWKNQTENFFGLT